MDVQFISTAESSQWINVSIENPTPISKQQEKKIQGILESLNNYKYFIQRCDLGDVSAYTYLVYLGNRIKAKHKTYVYNMVSTHVPTATVTVEFATRYKQYLRVLLGKKNAVYRIVGDCDLDDSYIAHITSSRKKKHSQLTKKIDLDSEIISCIKNWMLENNIYINKTTRKLSIDIEDFWHRANADISFFESYGDYGCTYVEKCINKKGFDELPLVDERTDIIEFDDGYYNLSTGLFVNEKLDVNVRGFYTVNSPFAPKYPEEYSAWLQECSIDVNAVLDFYREYLSPYKSKKLIRILGDVSAVNVVMVPIELVAKKYVHRPITVKENDPNLETHPYLVLDTSGKKNAWVKQYIHIQKLGNSSKRIAVTEYGLIDKMRAIYIETKYDRERQKNQYFSDATMADEEQESDENENKFKGIFVLNLIEAMIGDPYRHIDIECLINFLVLATQLEEYIPK